MAMFNSYVSLPEGKRMFQLSQCVSNMAFRSTIWRFPEKRATPNHHKIDQLSIETNRVGDPPLGVIYIYI
jgi:hypothetical protein